jgi:flagellar basal-body rod protein FlgF
MVNGLYTASRSMRLIENKVETTSHNLANVNSTGFKKSMLVTMGEVKIERNDEYKLHQDEDQKLSQSYLDFEAGSFIQTDNPFDMAIQDDGFFAIETAEGVRFSRAGSFVISPEGNLSTLQGYNVLDQSNSPIHLNDNGKIAVGADGTVSGKDGEIAKLAIYTFEDKQSLQRTGHNLFKSPDDLNDAVRAPSAKVKQGFLEGSNVNTIDSMVSLIRFQRQFEASQKMVTSIDGTLEKAVNEIGRVQG